MMSLLNHAPWADWAAKPFGKDETTAQATSETPGGEVALKKADESHDNKTLGGSIPKIWKTPMNKEKELEEVHISALSEFIYGHQWLDIKDVKEMLIAAAPATAEVNQAIKEINALVKPTTSARQKAQGTN